MPDFILSVDLGTSSVKVALFSEAGALAGVANHEYALLTPNLSIVEVEVETYWKAFRKGVGEVLTFSGVDPEQIRVIGISAQGETLIPVDAAGKPLRNAIVWMDNRAENEARYLSKRFNNQTVYEVTGQVSIVPTWPAAKILWIRNNEPDIFRKTHKFLLIEDYFIHRMTGEYVSEGSLLCSTVYWNINTKKYWPEMLGELGITEKHLPDIRESGEKVASLHSAAAERLGLSSETVVCTGALDQAAGAIGVGNAESGIFSECTGSALAVAATVNASFRDPDRSIPCHYHGIPNRYMAHTFTTGGMVLKWFRDQFYSGSRSRTGKTENSTYKEMDSGASAVSPGADGLIMLPHLQGAMAPENNPRAKGVFYGLTLAHTRDHCVRAIMEGIVFILKRNIDAIEKIGISVNEIRSLGGGAKSQFWNQLKADITGKTVLITSGEEEACLGAAITAGVGVGMFPDIQTASKDMIKVKDRFEPRASNSRIYQSIYGRYKDLYTNLMPMFEDRNQDGTR